MVMKEVTLPGHGERRHFTLGSSRQMPNQTREARSKGPQACLVFGLRKLRSLFWSLFARKFVYT